MLLLSSYPTHKPNGISYGCHEATLGQRHFSPSHSHASSPSLMASSSRGLSHGCKLETHIRPLDMSCQSGSEQTNSRKAHAKFAPDVTSQIGRPQVATVHQEPHEPLKLQVAIYSGHVVASKPRKKLEACRTHASYTRGVCLREATTLQSLISTVGDVLNSHNMTPRRPSSQ